MKRAIAIADGPSAKAVDLSVLVGKPVFTIGTHRRLDAGNTGNAAFTPDAILLNDPDVVKEQLPNLLSYRGLLVMRDDMEKHGLVPGAVYHLDHKQSYKCIFPEKGESLNLFTFNTGILAIQWLYQQGYDFIGLIGFDLYYPQSGPTHSFGDGPVRGTSGAMFPRAIKWFSKFSERFKQGNPAVVRLWQDPLCPLNQWVRYLPLSDFLLEAS